MDVGFLVLADWGEALNGKLYALGAGWNMLHFPELPQDWGFTVGLGLDVPWGETNRKHQMEMRFDDPDGQPLSDPFEADVEIGRPPGMIQGQDQRVTFAISTQQTFTQAGPHAVVISVGGEEIGRTRFYVVQAPAVTS